jgi:hypothetical protein
MCHKSQKSLHILQTAQGRSSLNPLLLNSCAQCARAQPSMRSV